MPRPTRANSIGRWQTNWPAPTCSRAAAGSSRLRWYTVAVGGTNTSSREKAFVWNNFDAFLFDIDGTLLNSRDWVHYNAFHTALRTVYQCDARIDSVPVHGSTDPGILRAASRLCGVDEARFQAGLSQARTVMANEVEANASDLRPELCDSIRTLVERLHRGGKLLGICTGNLERIGWTKLKKAGIREFFEFGSFSDKRESRVEIFRWGVQQVRTRLGDQARICVLGDTPNDIQAAQALSIPVVALATGTHSLAQLQEHTPDWCVSCCAELL